MKSALERVLTGAGLVALLLFAAAPALRASGPFADVHVHFNWDQKEIIDAARIVEKMRRANVEFAVVASTPSALALEPERAGGDLIVPLLSPCTHALGKRDWCLRQQTVQLAREGLTQGCYRGIGEIHFMSGFRPRIDDPVFLQLLACHRSWIRDLPPAVQRKLRAENARRFFGRQAR